jgi:hypothetical protein
VATENAGSRERRRQTEPEFTTRPRRLLMIGRMDLGHELAILEAQLHYPAEVAVEAGIEVVEAFVGSGYYALLLEIDGEDAQEALEKYLNDPRIRAFHGSLRPFVEGLPGPDWQFVVPDPLRARLSLGQQEQPLDGPAYSSAHLALAASMYRWSRGGAEAGGP